MNSCFLLKNNGHLQFCHPKDEGHLFAMSEILKTELLTFKGFALNQNHVGLNAGKYLGKVVTEELKSNLLSEISLILSEKFKDISVKKIDFFTQQNPQSYQNPATLRIHLVLGDALGRVFSTDLDFNGGI